jgi:hypothetical protein
LSGFWTILVASNSRKSGKEIVGGGTIIFKAWCQAMDQENIESMFGAMGISLAN